MLLIDGARYELTTPKNEAVLEKAIQANCEDIFGPDSFYFDIKSKLRSRAGVVSIPDAYVIYFASAKKAQWAIIEVELASHPVYEHVVPQLSKFNRGIEDSSTKRKLVEVLYSIFDEDEVLKAKLKQRIKSGEVYKFISDLISEKPLIVVAIDKRTEQLDEGLHDIRGDVRVVEFKTFRRKGISDTINAYLFEPVHAKAIDVPTIVIPKPRQKDSKKREGVMYSIFELFDSKGIDNVTYDECEALARQVKPDTRFDKSHLSWYKNKYKEKRSGGLPRGLRLRNIYKGVVVMAEVIVDGKIIFDGQTYESPSMAAVAAIQSLGSKRKTQNGWSFWKFVDPETGKERPIDIFRK